MKDVKNGADVRNSLEFWKVLAQSLGLGAVTCALIYWGGEGAEAVGDGLALCVDVIIPSMFPFFIISNLVMDLGISVLLGWMFAPLMYPLFGLPGATGTALVLGLVGGYPIGAKTTVSLYQSGQCTRGEGNRLLAFSNNAGPGFILGVIGTGMYGSLSVGLLLYLSHVLGSFCIGLALAQKGRKGLGQGVSRGAVSWRDLDFGERDVLSAFLRSVTGAMEGTMRVCAFVLCFTVLLRLLSVCGAVGLVARGLEGILAPLGLPASFFVPLVLGFVEMTSGVTGVSGGSFPLQMGLLSFFLAWGGCSVHAQALCFIGESDLSARAYLLGKWVQGLLSCLFAFVFGHFIEVAPLGMEVGSLTTFASGAGLWRVSVVLPLVIALVVEVIYIFLYLFWKKGWKNFQK